LIFLLLLAEVERVSSRFGEVVSGETATVGERALKESSSAHTL